MNKLRIAIVAVALAIVAAIGTHYIVRAIQRHSDTVYLCTGEYSKAYHCTTHCKGLDNCSADVIVVDKYDARRRYHRHPCAYCYGKRWEEEE